MAGIKQTQDLITGINNLSIHEIVKLLVKNKESALPLESDFPAELLKGKSTPAAVLVPIFRKENQWQVLFIRRTQDHTAHSGQVAFPGGRANPEDQSIRMTALREAWEEIGLLPNDVNILGELPGFRTITNYEISPYVCYIPWPYEFCKEEKEVARIFSVPLSWLAESNNREIRQRILPAPYSPISVTYFHSYDEEVIWGATARIMISFLKVLLLV